MKTGRLLVVALALAAVSTVEADAQGFLDRLGKRVQQKAEEAITRKAEQATEKVIDKVTDADTYKGDGSSEAGQQAPPAGALPGGAMPGAAPAAQPEAAPVPQAPGQSLEMAYAKSDFVPGDEIMFDDDVTREQLGEFPSQWDLLKGVVEVAQINGEKVILGVSQDDPRIAPLFEDMQNYLPDKFTIEFDFWVGPWAAGLENGNPENNYRLYFFKPGSRSQIQDIYITSYHYNTSDFRTNLNWHYTPGGGGDGRGGNDDSFRTIPNAWNHFALSFNQRAMKIYINGVRYANIPNTEAPGHFELQFYRGGGWHAHNSSIKNFRIAKGAVPLYDRMMSDGKFITYGITFDVGKSTIKPESMGEINRIVQLMNENPTLKFSVEGHTDSTGNAASNQTLSEARSSAIVSKLVELGIAADRLAASGKGQNSPIADNSTDEGRAKNRRVEFVKM